jgi:hypothetical protein
MRHGVQGFGRWLKKVLGALGGLPVNIDAKTWMPASATP